MVSLQLSRFLIYASLAFILCSQVSCQRIRYEDREESQNALSSETCPREHRCRYMNTCRPSLMAGIKGDPIRCGGFSGTGGPKICCPERSSQTQTMPIRVPVMPTRERVMPTSDRSRQPAASLTSNREMRLEHPGDGCPRQHTCRERISCRRNAVKLIRGSPVSCGFSSRGRQRICCPDLSSPRVAVPLTRAPVGAFTVPTRITTPVPLNANPGNCGIAFGQPSREGYVIGGSDAEQGAWPWMVSIMMANKRGVQSPSCTGFLIDKRHVLSAAHCFHKKQPSLYSTRIGHVDLRRGDVYPISKIVVHERYNKGQYYNDIALLTLSKDVSIPNFSPICLPSAHLDRNLTGMGTTVVGWGSTSIGGPMSFALKQLSAMPIVSNEMCEVPFRERSNSFVKQFPYGISPTMICAGFVNERGKDSCGGDSGGPLMMQERDRWYAVGLVSFGYQCGKPGFAGGYTKISEFVNWIYRNMN